MNHLAFNLKLGLGTFPFSGVFRDVSQQEADAIVAEFIAAGGRYIETAPVYPVRSVSLPAILAGHPRSSYFIATKCVTAQDHAGGKIRSGKHEFIVRQCEAEIHRLGVEFLDLLQAHAIPTDVPLSELGRALQELLDRGLVRHIGVSNVDVSQLRVLCDVAQIEVVQVRHSLLHTVEYDRLVTYATSKGILFNPYQVIERGQLSTDSSRRADWGPADLRHSKPEFSSQRDETVRAWVSKQLVPIAQQVGLTVEGLAIAWMNAQRGVMLPVVGVTRTSQLPSLLLGAKTLIDSDTQGRIEHALHELHKTVANLGVSSIDEYRGIP